MQETYTNKRPNDFDDEIDIQDFFYTIFKGKWLIISITTFISIIAVIYSLGLPNIYESKSILTPINSSDSFSQSNQGYSSLAGLAGINLSSGTNKSNSVKALEKLSSLSFFENNILRGIFLPNLMAVKTWDYKTNTLIYDDTLYNNASGKWIRDYSYPNKQIPSSQESFKVFQEHISLSKEKNTGFITLTVKHQSPFIAKYWNELLIKEINAFYRQKDKLESESALSYLNSQIAMTNLSEIKQVIAELLQQETQKLTLIEANQFYVFEYIDPPAVMEHKSDPKRSLICILGALFGLIIGTFTVLIRRYIFRKKTA